MGASDCFLFCRFLRRLVRNPMGVIGRWFSVFLGKKQGGFRKATLFR